MEVYYANLVHFGRFQTFVIFTKIKTRWNFWILFLKTVHLKGFLEQIKKKLNFCFCHRIVENYWQPLLTIFRACPKFPYMERCNVIYHLKYCKWTTFTRRILILMAKSIPGNAIHLVAMYVVTSILCTVSNGIELRHETRFCSQARDCKTITTKKLIYFSN